jgi:hypothetical protein
VVSAGDDEYREPACREIVEGHRDDRAIGHAHQMNGLGEELIGKLNGFRLEILPLGWCFTVSGAVRGDQLPTLAEAALFPPGMPTTEECPVHEDHPRTSTPAVDLHATRVPLRDYSAPTTRPHTPRKSVLTSSTLIARPAASARPRSGSGSASDSAAVLTTKAGG